MAFNLLLKPQLQYFLNKLFPLILSYGICETEKSSVSKVVILSGFALKKGAHISVRFSDTSTNLPSSGNISLNVNNTGSKTIYISESNDICDYKYASYFGNNKVYQFVYDGSNWIWNNKDYESDALITTIEFENLT